jgi:hypothetical protein
MCGPRPFLLQLPFDTGLLLHSPLSLDRGHHTLIVIWVFDHELSDSFLLLSKNIFVKKFHEPRILLEPPYVQVVVPEEQGSF